MTRPHRYLLRMTVFLVIVAAACTALAPKLMDAFTANVVLNTLILSVLALGVVYIFRQIIVLRPEINWLEHLQRESSGGLIFPGSLSEQRPPRLLAPMATMLGERRGRISLSAISMRTLVDGIQSRIQESHEISRYLIGLLIFLGLLGTFWGPARDGERRQRHHRGPGQDRDGSGGPFRQLHRGPEGPGLGHGNGVQLVAVRAGRLARARLPRTPVGPGAQPLPERTGGMVVRVDAPVQRRSGRRRRTFGARLHPGASGEDRR